MPTIRLPVIEAWSTDDHLVMRKREGSGDAPGLRGDGPHTWVCGACGHVLAQKMANEILPGETDPPHPTVMVCPKCGAGNEVWTANALRAREAEAGTIKLSVIPNPGENAAVVEFEPGAGFAGAGDADLVCGACGAVLASKMYPGQITGVVLRCSCGAYNRT